MPDTSIVGMVSAAKILLFVTERHLAKLVKVNTSEK